MPSSHFNLNDQLQIERVDGRITFGKFVREDERYMIVTGVIGHDIGHEIIVPRDKIMQIIVVKKARHDGF